MSGASRYAKSDRWLPQALRWTPQGAQTMSKAPARFPQGAYPVVLDRGRGAWVWDVDDHRYLDWSAALGAVLLGHGHAEVTKAVRAQLRKGTSFSLPTRLEAEVAEALCQVFPCGGATGSVRFVKTGSEANAAACRIARRITGRELILCCGYLGWHDWTLVRQYVHPGVPDGLDQFVQSFQYNDLASVEAAAAGRDVAAVLLEPVMFEPPALGFLEGLRVWTHQHGALLIFDENVCGGRWAPGGAQEYFSVTPDLCTFGKGWANGLPLAGVMGPRALMQAAETVSGTFGGEALSLAACRAVLACHRREDVCARLWRTGTALMEGINALDMAVHLAGYAVHPRLVFPHDPDQEQMSLFLQETAARGLLLHPGGLNVMAAHGPRNVRLTVRRCREALDAMGRGAALRGQCIQPNAFVRPVAVP